MTQTYELDVAVTRGSLTESTHRVHAAVVDASDTPIAAARDPEMVTFTRSCAKPFQVMPLVESGGIDALRWGADELALACASHGGEPEHVALAESMLHALGMEEGDLACGPQEPLSARGARIMREAGLRPTRLHNNCSGKHAAMLARAHTAGWPTYGYEREGHQVQRAITETVARWSGVPCHKLGQAVDGCGAPVFSMPLHALARAFARLGDAARRGDEVPQRIVDAMLTRPFLVGGTDRFDSVLIEETEGRILSKVGAEGVHAAAILDEGVGVVLKVEDGAQRAQYPALLRLLQKLGALPDVLPPRLQEIMVRPLRNSRGEVVGEIRPVK